MPGRRLLVGGVLLGLGIGILGLALGGPMADVGAPDIGAEPPTTTPQSTTTSGSELATVTFATPEGERLGQIEAMVADTPAERYTGLSDTEALPPNGGMVFVYPDAGDRTYVMRDMDFPLDIVFVDADGTITQIHHAPVETDSDLTRYSGRAKWVVEVNRGWTTTHDVSVGDTVSVTLPE